MNDLATLNTFVPESISAKDMFSNDYASKPAELKIQYPILPENWDVEEKGPIPPSGVWKLWNQGSVVYSPEVKFRLLYRTFFVTEKDTEGKELERTVEYINMAEMNVPDTTGGFRLNKVKSSEKDKLSKPELAHQRNLPFWERLYVLASLTGSDGNGEPTSMESVVSIYNTKASTRGAWMDYLQTLKGNRVNPVNNWHTATLEKKKAGTVVYWVPVFKLGAPTDDDEGAKVMIKDTEQAISEYIAVSNRSILSLFYKIRGENPNQRMLNQEEDDYIPYIEG